MVNNEVSPRALDLPHISYQGFIQVANFAPDFMNLEVPGDGSARGFLFDAMHPGQFILKMSLIGSYDKNTQGIFLRQVVNLPVLPLIFSGVVFSANFPGRIDLLGTVKRGFFDEDFDRWRAILDPLPH